MRVIVVALLLFGIVVQGVLLPWSTNRNYIKPRKDNLINSGNILKNIGHKINRIFLPWSSGVRRNSMEERRLGKFHYGPNSLQKDEIGSFLRVTPKQHTKMLYKRKNTNLKMLLPD